MNQVSDRVQKLVTFSPKLYNNALARANNLGIPFAEYVRHLLLKDVEENNPKVPMIDAATEKRIGQSLKDLKEGRYTVIKNEKELDAHLDNIL